MRLLSIIIPTYNSESSIEACIDSIISQTFTDYEILIQDGASTDRTLEILLGLKEKYNTISISIQSEPDGGVYFAMNKGIQRASGKWLYFLGSDDTIYEPGVLAFVFDDPANHLFDLVYGKVVYRDSKLLYGEETSYYQMLKTKRNVAHQAIFYAKTVFDLVGLYGARHLVYADFELNLKCFKDDRIKKHFVDRVIAVFSQHGLSKNGTTIDDFYSGLLDRYVSEFENPSELYLNQLRLQEEVRILSRSLDYRFGKVILSPFRKIKWWLKGTKR